MVLKDIKCSEALCIVQSEAQSLSAILNLFSSADFKNVSIVAHYIKGDTIADRGQVRVFEWAGPISALAAFPVIVFAYTCHQNVRLYPNDIAWTLLTSSRCSPFSMRLLTTLTSAQQQSSSLP